MKTLLFSFCILFSCAAQAQTITTIAGNGSQGYSGDHNNALSAQLYAPIGVAVDQAGNVYVADAGNNVIRKMNPAGIITTVAGNGYGAGMGAGGYSGDTGPATMAELHLPYDVAVDDAGNLYIADLDNGAVRKVNSAGIITTFAGRGGLNPGDGGPATAAQIGDISGVATDAAGNVYFSDQTFSRIRKVDIAGIITTVAGNGVGGYGGDNGPASSAEIEDPEGLAVDAAGNIYFADQQNNIVRKVDTNGIITTIAGTPGTIEGFSGDNGPATAAQLAGPSGVDIDSAGNVYIGDWGNNRVRMVSPAGIITTVAGTAMGGYNGDNQPATAAELNGPRGVACDAAGNLFIGDYNNNRVRRVLFHFEAGAGIITSPSAAMNLYPNPTSGSFTIHISSSLAEGTMITITNLLGEKIKELAATPNTDIRIQLDAPPGIYFVSATTKNATLVKKIFVE